MELAARRYVRRVLLGHLLLLALVLLIVAAAVRYLYHSSRQQAIDEAKSKQELLSRQTALGIQNYYESVTNVLEMLQPDITTTPDEEPTTETSTTPVAPAPAPAPVQGPPREGFRRQGQRPGGGGGRFTLETLRRRAVESPQFLHFAASIWNSIREKSSLLVVLDDDGTLLKVLGTGDGAPDPAALAKDLAPFLPTVRQTSITHFLKDAGPGGAHVVCVRMRPLGGGGGPNGGPGGGERGGPRGGGGEAGGNPNVPGGANAQERGHLIMAAVMPIDYLERNLLHDVNRSATTGMLLIDDSGTFVSAPGHDGVVGRKLEDLQDPRTRQLAASYVKSGTAGTEIFEHGETIGAAVFKPAMSTIEPVEVLGKRWFAVINSSLDDVDRIVKPIFRDALAWAVFLIAAMTGILLSTAVQMIRGRMRFERAQMDILNRELMQARQIQLQWLPDQPCSFQQIDLAAVNMPASHVSGDFYNWFELPDGRIVVMVGDVTGHGMAAAFLMATTQLLVRTTMPGLCNPGLCLEEVNRQLCTQVFSGQFVTMLVMILDLCNGRMDVASAGHPPPLVGKGDRFEPLDLDPQLVLGVEPTMTFPSHEYALPRDATMVLYTDGVLDVQAPSGDRFRAEGLIKSLCGRFESARAVITAVTEAVTEFRGGQELADDLTLVALQLQPATTAREQRLVSAVSGG